ncbi:MAG: phosphatidylserine/phosphatidylglycerophosphate/cardiolipin synthase family protein, partial [Myxococcales bacterium]|nr:phosphatidylserine/phosphatidylglycerophosphate/cardiolipin synthase family protein [Myxococcales bacterium]
RFFAVRLDARRPCRALRARWRGTPVEALLDAGTVLRDGHPDDLPDRAAPIRLARVARHLRTAGVEVDLVLLDGPDHGYTAIAPEAWTALSAEARARRLAAARWPLPEDDNARLRTLTGAARTTATRLDLEFDNAVARERLLALIEGAEHRIALQTYIFEDDAIGRRVAAALIAAADRGVEVFVLVDSLYSLHGALGRQNPTLATLEAHRGVSLRAIRPFTLPDLGSLKQRDHRKLLIIDDRIGRITGRNLGAPYFTDFAEVPLTREHSYRDVPWLDIGAEVEGPIVHAMNLAFRESWLDAGGTRFRLPDPGPPGDLAVRLVLHESMRDAQTLDAYRALIEAATSHVIIVNTFPLQFELQSALIDALARGVTVRFLVGHVRPLFGEARQPFRGGALRALATEVIHGRLDALVAAGAEAWAYARRDLPGWAADLGTVLPHVHAKLMSVDGRRFTIGSANLDITAGYWESEALLLVEDEARTQALETTLGALFSEQAVRIDTDPRWRETSARRTFVSRNWPSVLG